MFTKNNAEKLVESIPLVDKEEIKNYYKSNFQILETDKLFIDKIREIDEEDRKSVLICGFPKSGNTWARFVIYNYFCVKYNERKETLTYDELNKLQSAKLGSETDNSRLCIRGNGIPYIVRTHARYRKVFKYFDKVIFIYRNPLDALISRYFKDVKYKNIDNEAKNVGIDTFVIDNIDVWINHFLGTYPKSDIVMSYQKRKEDPIYEHKKLISIIDDEICEKSLKKSVEISSFDNIKAMGEQKSQRQGMHEKKLKESYNFARSGRVNQFYDHMSLKAIRACKEKIRHNGVQDYVM